MPISRSKQLTAVAHEIAAGVLRPGDTAIDATAGNGHDTAFLAEKVGAGGYVYSFDIQQAALDATRARLEKSGLAERVALILAGHETMPAHLPPAAGGNVSAVFFNFGYLPHGNEKVITKPETTLSALEHSKILLRSDGLLSLLVYPAHAGGAEEAGVVKNWIQNQVAGGDFTFSFFGNPDENERPWLATGVRIRK